jgi:endonuclease/exonuclease/phosphatase family metal-dependent hydrolase
MTINLRYDNPKDGSNKWCFRKKPLASLITRNNPDLFGTQEGWEDQINELQVLLPSYRYYISPPEWNRKRMFPVVWGKKDIMVEKNHTFWLSPTPYLPFSKAWGSAFPRAASYVIAKKGQLSFLFVNAHLDMSSEETRLNQTIVLLKEINKIKKTPQPIFLVGDFNTIPHSPIHAILTGREKFNQIKGNFIDVWQWLNKPEESTFHGFTGKGMRGRMDWILVSPGVIIKKAEILKDSPFGIYPTDHFIVIAEFVL